MKESDQKRTTRTGEHTKRLIFKKEREQTNQICEAANLKHLIRQDIFLIANQIHKVF
jgi:hypothetical protein